MSQPMKTKRQPDQRIRWVIEFYERLAREACEKARVEPSAIHHMVLHDDYRHALDASSLLEWVLDAGVTHSERYTAAVNRIPFPPLPGPGAPAQDQDPADKSTGLPKTGEGESS